MASGLEPFTGKWGEREATHLIKRTMFGAKLEDIQFFSNLPFNDAYSIIIRNSYINYAPPINVYGVNDPDPDVPIGKTWVNAPFSSHFGIARMWSCVSWWINRLVHQDSTITEKMILFWHNHFGINTTSSIDARANYHYINKLQAFALGNFKTLIKEITADPLMLHFLNGFQNEAFAPDENYARELMELFTLGKGPESKYTEDDVKAAAKVLTGFVFDTTTAATVFFIDRHDLSNKTFSSFFNNKTITGITKSENWQIEIHALIDMIFEKDEVSKFMCRKFYRFFVNSEISPEIEKAIIEPLAQIFRENNYEIKPVITKLLSCQHFYDNDNIGSMIKSPIDFLIGAVREMKANIPNPSDYLSNSGFLEFTRRILGALQQDLPNPPNVAGWPAYYQNPIYGRSWINSETLKLRGGLLENLIENKINPQNLNFYIDLIAYSNTISGVADPNVFIDNVLKNLISLNPNPAYKLFLKKILLSNQDNDYYWTNAWEDYWKNPTDKDLKSVLETRLRAFYKNILQLDEYNLH